LLARFSLCLCVSVLLLNFPQHVPAAFSYHPTRRLQNMALSFQV
jgi:hypothetical protein